LGKREIGEMTKKPESVNKLDQLSLVESQLRFKGNYKDGKPDGLFEEFDEEGNLTKTEEWKDGELV